MTPNSKKLLIIAGVILIVLIVIAIPIGIVASVNKNSKSDDENFDKTYGKSVTSKSKTAFCGHKDCPRLENLVLPSVRIPKEEELSAGNFSNVVPLHYTLKIRVNRDSHRYLNGTLKIKAQFLERTKIVLLHSELRSLSIIGKENYSQIFAYKSCSQKVNCLKTAQILGQILILEFSEFFEKNEIYFLEFGKFTVDFLGETALPIVHDKIKPYSTDGAVLSKEKYSQRLPATEIGAFFADKMSPTWVFGTQFRFKKARTLFPCFDHPALKATFDVCLEHQNFLVAVGNTKSQSRRPISDILDETCFETTPTLATYQVGFGLLENMRKIELGIINSKDSKNHTTSQSNVLYNSPSTLTKLEVYFPSMYWSWLGWVPEKISRILAEIHRKVTLTHPYPMKKLTVVVMMGVHFEENTNFGLVFLTVDSLESSDVQKAADYDLRHRLFHSYLGASITVRDFTDLCLEEGFVRYMAWELLKAAKNYSTDARDVIFNTGHALFQQFPANLPLAGPKSFRRTDWIPYYCYSGKPLFAFETISLAYGKEIYTPFLSLLLDNHSFGNAGLAQWKAALSAVSKTHTAGEMLESWFTEPGMPIIQLKLDRSIQLGKIPIRLTSNRLNVVQLRALGQDKDSSGFIDSVIFKSPAQIKQIGGKPFIFPLKIASLQDYAVHSVQIIDDFTKQVPLNISMDKFYADPDGVLYAHILYDAQEYLNIAECYSDNEKCPVNLRQFSRLYGSFCFGLHNNVLPEVDDSSKPIWTEVFDKLVDILFQNENNHQALQRYTCTCCLLNGTMLSQPALGTCTKNYISWCSRVQILEKIGRNLTDTVISWALEN